MTHYQKTATILIRFLCLIGFFVGLVGLSESSMIWMAGDYLRVQYFNSSIFYLIFSIVLFVLSKQIAKLICKGIDDNV